MLNCEQTHDDRFNQAYHAPTYQGLQFGRAVVSSTLPQGHSVKTPASHMMDVHVVTLVALLIAA